jgi:hypothetical protein
MGISTGMYKWAPIVNETLVYWDELHPTYPHGIGRYDWLTTHGQFVCNGGTGSTGHFTVGARTKSVEWCTIPEGIIQ